MRSLVLAAAAWVLAGQAAAAVLIGTPDDYRRLIPQLRPGDVLVLAPGEYRDGLTVQDVAGAPGRPITISGPQRGAPAVFVARAGRSTVTLADTRHLVIRNLVLEGDDVPVDAVKAVKPSRPVHDVTLENLVIRGHGNNQQTVGISTKCPAWNWIIRGNTIIGAGTGMYLGDSDGSAPFVAGVIERNVIVDAIGYDLQIKHQNSRRDIPGMPTKPSTTIVRHNVFAKAGGVATEAPRPNVLVGHFPPAGPGAEDDYAIYGNFFYQNRGEALFQGEGNIALYDNLFVNEHGDAIRIQPHNDVPRRILVAYNTVVAKGAGVTLSQKEGAPSYPQSVRANVVFAGIPIRGGEQSGNLAAAMSAAGEYLNRPYAALGELDLYPRRRWPRMKPANAAVKVPFPDGARDFNGRPRLPGTIGAYSGTGTNPGWLPRLQRKPG